MRCNKSLLIFSLFLSALAWSQGDTIPHNGGPVRETGGVDG